MKNNTNELKTVLYKALSQMPQDFALSEVRHYLKLALSKLEHVEKKRTKRESNLERRKAIVENSFVFQQPDALINQIDQEINKEKLRIEEIRRKRLQKKDGDDDDSTDGELQTLFS